MRFQIVICSKQYSLLCSHSHFCCFLRNIEKRSPKYLFHSIPEIAFKEQKKMSILVRNVAAYKSLMLLASSFPSLR